MHCTMASAVQFRGQNTSETNFYHDLKTKRHPKYDKFVNWIGSPYHISFSNKSTLTEKNCEELVYAMNTISMHGIFSDTSNFLCESSRRQRHKVADFFLDEMAATECESNLNDMTFEYTSGGFSCECCAENYEYDLEEEPEEEEDGGE